MFRILQRCKRNSALKSIKTKQKTLSQCVTKPKLQNEKHMSNCLLLFLIWETTKLPIVNINNTWKIFKKYFQKILNNQLTCYINKSKNKRLKRRKTGYLIVDAIKEIFQFAFRTQVNRCEILFKLSSFAHFSWLCKNSSLVFGRIGANEQW